MQNLTSWEILHILRNAKREVFKYLLSLQKNGAGIVSEFEVKDITREGCEKASPEQFDLLRVLGQGSFGKVSHSLLKSLG